MTDYFNFQQLGFAKYLQWQIRTNYANNDMNSFKITALIAINCITFDYSILQSVAGKWLFTNNYFYVNEYYDYLILHLPIICLAPDDDNRLHFCVISLVLVLFTRQAFAVLKESTCIVFILFLVLLVFGCEVSK